MYKSLISPFGELLLRFRSRRRLTQSALATALGTHRNTIGRWERGEVLPDTRGIVLELARLLQLEKQDTYLLLEASLTSLTPYWSVPFRQNPSFTGREMILNALHQRLTGDARAVALSGLGGIGKTQIAIEYAHRNILEYNAVFWVVAETAESLMSGIQEIAEQLQLPERQAAKQSQVVSAVQRWLNVHQRWLLIVDNIEEPVLVQSLLPSTRKGALLLTTRRQTLGNLAEPLEVLPMDNREGTDLLLRRAHWSGIPVQGDASLSSQRLSTASVLAASELVTLLEGLPLALDQAGAYIDETGCGVAEYLQRYQHQRKLVLARRGLHDGAHPSSVSTTLKLSVEQIEREHQGAADLLRMCAFLHSEAIPDELFLTEAAHLETALSPMIADPYQFDLTLTTLRSASLLKRHPETRTLTIHRLVQAVLRDEMESVETRLWSERVVRMINVCFSPVTVENWSQCERVLLHAQKCRLLIEQEGLHFPEAADLMDKTGSYLLARGHYQQAEPFLRFAVVLYEQCYGSEEPEVAIALDHLAQLLGKQGRLQEAVSLSQHAFNIREERLGSLHLLTAESLLNLGELYWEQGLYEQAESFCRRALTIREHLLGPEHLLTAECLSNLALLLWRSGHYEQGEPLAEKALAIHEQQVGAEHPHTANQLVTLGSLYRGLHKYKEAERVLLRALAIREQHLGPEHPTTARCLNNLAALYLDQDKYVQAETLFQRTLAIYEHQLGPEHIRTARALRNLAMLYVKQGRDTEAEPLYQRALAITEQQMGVAHPQTAKMREDYSSLQKQRLSWNAIPGKEQAGSASAYAPKEPLYVVPERTPLISQQEIDPLQAFLTASCDLHPQAWSRSNELWQAYERWAKEQQEPFPLSRRSFTASLKELGCHTHRTNNARIWRGIALKKTP